MELLVSAVDKKSIMFHDYTQYRKKKREPQEQAYVLFSSLEHLIILNLVSNCRNHKTIHPPAKQSINHVGKNGKLYNQTKYATTLIAFNFFKWKLHGESKSQNYTRKNRLANSLSPGNVNPNNNVQTSYNINTFPGTLIPFHILLFIHYPKKDRSNIFMSNYTQERGRAKSRIRTGVFNITSLHLTSLNGIPWQK